MLVVEYRGPRDGTRKLEEFMRSHGLEIVEPRVQTTLVGTRDVEVLAHVLLSVGRTFTDAAVAGAGAVVGLAAVQSTIDSFKRTFNRPVLIEVREKNTDQEN